MPSPFNAPELFDKAVLGTMSTPGTCKLSGHDSEEDWDVKTVPGQKGATMTRKSKKPIEFTVTCSLVDDSFAPGGSDQFAEWDAFCALVESTVSGPKPVALPFYHPDTARRGIEIGAVVKKKIHGLVHDNKGGATGAVTLIEYRPPKPVGGSATAKKKNTPDPNQDLQDEIDKLTKRYQATPWG